MQHLSYYLQSGFVDSWEAIAAPWLIKTVVIVLILLLSQVLKKTVLTFIFKRLETLTAKTDTTLDDQLIDILRPPLGWLLFLIALWCVKLIVTDSLDPALYLTISQFLDLTIISIVAYIFFKLSPLLGRITSTLTLRTGTELDDLFVPYLPKLFQVAAILVVILKGSEVLLGVSANAIIGVLGGAGIAFGLLIKDVIYEWCCTIIVYLDGLYRVGDELTVSGVEGPVEVLEIGLRSTKLGIQQSNAVKKVPNSTMISGVVENKSQPIAASQSQKIVQKMIEIKEDVNELKELEEDQQFEETADESPEMIQKMLEIQENVNELKELEQQTKDDPQ